LFIVVVVVFLCMFLLFPISDLPSSINQ
jgi:hypothetical protein